MTEAFAFPLLSAAQARSNEQLAIAERDRASEQEALARKEKNRTQRLFDFLMESIRRADPAQPAGHGADAGHRPQLQAGAHVPAELGARGAGVCERQLAAPAR